MVNTVAWDSHSPLLDAVLNGDSRMIDVLVKYNADQTVRDMVNYLFELSQLI